MPYLPQAGGEDLGYLRRVWTNLLPTIVTALTDAASAKSNIVLAPQILWREAGPFTQINKKEGTISNAESEKRSLSLNA
jgi:hypothetical protein